MEKRLGFGATSGPAISVVKRVACREEYGRVRVLLAHISVCLGECGCNFKNSFRAGWKEKWIECLGWMGEFRKNLKKVSVSCG